MTPEQIRQIAVENAEWLIRHGDGPYPLGNVSDEDEAAIAEAMHDIAEEVARRG